MSTTRWRGEKKKEKKKRNSNLGRERSGEGRRGGGVLICFCCSRTRDSRGRMCVRRKERKEGRKRARSASEICPRGGPEEGGRGRAGGGGGGGDWILSRAAPTAVVGA